MLFCNIDLLDENFERKRGQYVGVKDGKIAYIGDADIVAEGEAVTIEKMTTSTRKATVKTAMKGIGLTDERLLQRAQPCADDAAARLRGKSAAAALAG